MSSSFRGGPSRSQAQAQAQGPGQSQSQGQDQSPSFSMGNVNLKERRPPLERYPSIGPDSVNPFEYRSRWSFVRFAISVACIPLFMLRIFLFLGTLIFGCGFVNLVLIGARDPLSKPFSPLRRMMLRPIRIGARFLLFLCGYVWIPVKGKCAPREVAPMLVSNHISFLEPLYLFYAHLPVIVSAKENLDLPIVGTLLHALQIISVDRTSSSSRRNVSAQIRRRCIDNLWPHVGIFPEGTTTNGKALISFKTGAFSPGLPVQPMVFRYGNTNPAWVLDRSPYLILFSLMTQPINFMQVEYLPVVIPARSDKQDPHLYAEKVRKRMAQALGIPRTDHTFLDLKLAIAAAKLKQPKGMSFVEFARMEKLFHLDYETAKEYLQKFSEMDNTHSGLLSINQFVKALDLPLNQYTKEVFQFFDKSDKGYINFREFVAGLTFLSQHSSFSKIIEAAFKACDSNNDGSISNKELEKSLKNIFPELSNVQVVNFFNALDLNHDGAISWSEFSTFLQRNPEYLAVIMTARPELLG